MSFFRKRDRPLSVRQQRIAGKIAGRILGFQLQVAAYLNGRTAGISAKKCLLLLVMFCLVFGGYCLYLLVGAVVN